MNTDDELLVSITGTLLKEVSMLVERYGATFAEWSEQDYSGLLRRIASIAAALHDCKISSDSCSRSRMRALMP
jgi:hypothetical protein